MGRFVEIERRKHVDAEFDALAWALKARSKDAKRTDLKCVKVEDGYFICTDGSRIHLVELKDKGIPDGIYEVTAANKAKITLRKTKIIFPNVWAALAGLRKLYGFHGEKFHGAVIQIHIAKTTYRKAQEGRES